MSFDKISDLTAGVCFQFYTWYVLVAFLFFLARERSHCTLNAKEGYDTHEGGFVYRVLCCTASATRSYAKPERELHQGTKRLLGCRSQCLLLVSAVCGSTPR